jgi:putative hydrolase of the HAD superfamily
MPWPQPQAIFFDAAGTLVYPNPSSSAVVETVLRRLAPSALPVDGRALGQHIDARMRQRRQAGHLVHYPPDEARAFWQTAYLTYFAAQLGPAQATVIADALLTSFTDLATWRLYDDVRPTLTALRACVPTIGLLSNWEDWLPDLLSALYLRDAFDQVIVSGIVGLEKPDPAIFQHALTLAGVEPSGCVYVGDSLHHDIEPCLALGIRAVLIDRDDQFSTPPSVLRLRDLRHLAPALDLPRL